MGTWFWRWLGLLLIVMLLVTGGAAGAWDSEPEVIQVPAMADLAVEDESVIPATFHPKLDSALNQLLEVQRTEGLSGARSFASDRQMVIAGDRVQVTLLSEPAAIPGLARAVEALGGELQGDYAGRLQALVPMQALEALAERSEVQVIRDPWRAIELQLPEAGSATTEGLAASNAGAWHSAGYDGTGVRVAIIDAGFTDYLTLLGSDLPVSVGTYDWTGSGMGGSEHGTACAEIVHDMAPGATMYLHKVSTGVNLGQAVTQAIADGVDVISMSLGWTLDGPGDGTGYLAGIVNTARANGIFYATAAGNDAEVNWAGVYDNSGTSGYHAWDGGTTWYNFMGQGSSCINFPAGYPIRGGLHWDDWSAVTQDYDLHLYRYPLSGTTLYRVASSTNSQNGGVGQTPQEYISYTAAGGNCYAWVVERVSSTRNVCLRMIAPKTGHFVHWTTARSLSYPADSPDAITVAAVDVDAPYPLESYSSQGPTFGPGGSCSGGAIKPDIASYANVSTVSYGPDNFNGTSAATPHVAGAAALVRGRYPGYSVTQMQDYLETEALELGVAGKDNLYGSGRLYLPPVMEPEYVVYLPLTLKGFGGTAPSAPALDPIENSDGDGDYQVCWSASAGATGYALQEADNGSFSGATEVYSGPNTCWDATGKPAGTYYYRVNASNPYGTSAWSNTESVVVQPSGGWTVIKSEGFEGAFPDQWSVKDNESTNGSFYWGKRDCRPYAGSHSGWAVGGGDGAGLACDSDYPTYVVAWLSYGPFSLADASDAELTFQLWLDSELDYDELFWGASIDGNEFWGYLMSGDTGGWLARTLDLTDVPTLGDLTGSSQVWIAFVFISDLSITEPEGAYVDDILLRKYVGSASASAEREVSAVPVTARQDVSHLRLEP